MSFNFLCVIDSNAGTIHRRQSRLLALPKARTTAQTGDGTEEETAGSAQSEEQVQVGLRHILL